MVYIKRAMGPQRRVRRSPVNEVRSSSGLERERAYWVRPLLPWFGHKLALYVVQRNAGCPPLIRCVYVSVTRIDGLGSKWLATLWGRFPKSVSLLRYDLL